MNIIINVVAAIFAFHTLASGAVAENKWLKHIPPSAVWVGASDGGFYLDLKPMKHKMYFFASIYADITGDILYQGKLKSDRVLYDFDPNNSSNYLLWDGNYLILSNGAKLKAMYFK